MSERAKGRASGPALISGFMAVLDHSEGVGWVTKDRKFEVHYGTNQGRNERSQHGEEGRGSKWRYERIDEQMAQKIQVAILGYFRP